MSQISKAADSPASPPSKVQIEGLWLDAISECDLVNVIRQSWSSGRGGTIVTVNVDIARAASRSQPLAELVNRGSWVVADGMPIVWAARLNGDVLPQRVSGSSLVYSLAAAAAADTKSLYLLGGAHGVPEKAASALSAQFAGLRVAGTDSPPFGFDQTESGIRQAIDSVVAAKPDLVFVGLGFPRQEHLIEKLHERLPETWFLSCGAGIAMAAGVHRRASPTIQRIGLEWAHRLILEPRRLARRYLRDDLPYAAYLLTRTLIGRVLRRRGRGG